VAVKTAIKEVGRSMIKLGSPIPIKVGISKGNGPPRIGIKRMSFGKRIKQIGRKHRCKIKIVNM